MNDSLRVASSDNLTEISKRLNDVDKAIKELQTEREVLQNRFAILHSQKSSIKRVPVEIWGTIFDSVIQPDSRSSPWFRHSCSHRDIASIMLSCRSFYQVIINTPQVWRRISLEAPGCNDDRKTIIAWATRQEAVISIFLSRSKSLLLDITINFEDLARSDEMIERRLEDAFSDLMEYEGVSPFLSEWQSDGMEACKEGYKQMIVGLVETLVGENGENIGRWRSLVVILPHDYEICWAIWSAIRGNASRLQTLTLSVDYDLFDLSSDIHHLSFPSVTSMVLYDGFCLRTAPYCQNILSLEISMSNITNWNGIQLLGQYSNLQRLLISSYQQDSNRPLRLSKIRLPNLQELSLTLWVPKGLLQALDLEDLSSLMVDCLWNGRGAPFPQIPFLSRVKKIVYGDRRKYVRPYLFMDLVLKTPEDELIQRDKIAREKDVNDLRATFQILFPQLSSVQTILVEEWELDIAIDVATACHNSGGLQALRSIGTFRRLPDIVEVAHFEFPSSSLPAVFT